MFPRPFNHFKVNEVVVDPAALDKYDDYVPRSVIYTLHTIPAIVTHKVVCVIFMVKYP